MKFDDEFDEFDKYDREKSFYVGTRLAILSAF